MSNNYDPDEAEQAEQAAFEDMAEHFGQTHDSSQWENDDEDS